ncbi:MAG: ABC-2 type transport system permease protein [Myxococcota bacterium]|jgi:ABC-2 type transport system permease protein
MNTIFLLARRELAAYMSTSWGVIILAGALLINGLLFNVWALGDVAKYSSDVLEKFFEHSSGVVMITGVLLTMRLIAEERQQGTMTLLSTAPITSVQIVIGKFLGAYSFLALIIVLTAYMPLLVLVNGKVSLGHVGAGYLGLLALGSAAVAIGTLGSAMAKNQLLAAVLGGVILVLFILGWLGARTTEAPISDVMAYSAIWDRHFQPFMRGRINTESLVYYGSMTFAPLLLATRILQSRRLS